MKLIAAADLNWGIGLEGRLQVRIPEDLARFKALTMGHPVILGRKTLETFPGGRPLPGRRNLILSGSPRFQPPGAEVYAAPEALLAAAPEDAFVIGGASVYKLLLPWCDTAYITRLETALPADCYMPNLDADARWRLAWAEPPRVHEGLTFRYMTYERIR